ncbi:hypothetical protein ACQP00_06545 [Dactylosporangium sp. CS-047395]|uniref:hypothetical protein n=1 Tax=Dactylosporangium sp. CS-047395 TaxID=3239936 RepID=UPI003D90E5FC
MVHSIKSAWLGRKGLMLIAAAAVLLVAGAGAWVLTGSTAPAVGCPAGQTAEQCSASAGASGAGGEALAPGEVDPGSAGLGSAKPSGSGRPASAPPGAGSGGNGRGGSTGDGKYPARYSVGAPGVGKYKQSDAKLPVPAGYQEVAASESQSKAYNLYTCGNITLDHKYIHGYIYIGTDCHGTVTITNSIIAPPPGSANRAILVNANSSGKLTLNISNTTIRPEPVGLGQKGAALNDHAINDCETCTIHLNKVDVANTGGMCLCGQNVTIENSWLHDNYIANLTDIGAAHTGGVFPYGGSGPLEIRNSRLEPGVDAFTGQEIPNYWKAITAVLFTQSAGGSTLTNYTVQNNFISLGAYGFWAQDGQNLRVRGNVFGPTHYGSTGNCTGGCKVTYAEWSDNLAGAIDGTPLAQAVQKPA